MGALERLLTPGQTLARELRAGCRVIAPVRALKPAPRSLARCVGACSRKEQSARARPTVTGCTIAPASFPPLGRQDRVHAIRNTREQRSARRLLPPPREAEHVGRVQLRPVRCSCTPAATPQCLAARRTRLITSKTSASVEASRARFVERSVVQTRWLRSGSRRANRRSQCNGLAAAAAHGRTGAAHSVPGYESAGRRRRCDRPLRPFAPGAATRAPRRWRPRCGQGRCPCPSSAANASCRPAGSGSATSASSTYRGPCPSPSTRGPSRCSTRARCCRPRWPPRRCIGPRE